MQITKQWHQYLLGAGSGFILGFLVLHPFSMLFQGAVHPKLSLDSAVIANAFSPHHLPMASFFGLLGLVGGVIIVLLLAALSTEKERVELLEGLLPICSYCKKINEAPGSIDQGDWVKIEKYISQRSAADFTHGVCPDCFEEKMLAEIDKPNGSH